MQLQRKYDQLTAQASKVMPMILNSEDPILVKEMTSKLRRFLPKAFFDITKRYMRDNKKSMQALGFAGEIVDDILVEARSIPEYI